jgi:hypothetical protein
MTVSTDWATDEDVLRSQLDAFGLGNLTKFVLGMLSDPNVTDDYIMAKIRQTQEYANRFPAMADLKAAGKGLSEQSYIDYERTVAESAQQAGLPGAMFDSTYIAKMLKSDVSPAEFQKRIGMASAAAYTAPEETRRALQDMYGMSQADLTAYWLDPDQALPILTLRQQAADIAGTGLRNDITISRQYAEDLAKQGITQSESSRGFETAASVQGLSSGSGETASQDELVRSQFGDVAAQQKVQRVASSRTARFAGGGQASESQSGVSGLGSASRN